MNNSFDFYYILPIILFGLFISLSVLNPYYKGRQKKRRSSPFIFSLIGLNLLISGSLYVVFGVISHRYEAKLESKQKRESEYRDSIQIIIDKQRLLTDEKFERDSITKYLQSYYDAYCVNDSNKLDEFYSFPLDRYYTLSNVPKEQVHERTNFENFNHKYPNCKIKKDKIIINRKGQDTLEVIIELKQAENKKYYTNFLLGKDMKIFSVISIIATPDLSDGKEEKKRKRK